MIDLANALPHYPALADFIPSADFARRDEIVSSASLGPKVSDIEFLPVIPRPEKIVCAVRNYLDHHNEAVAFGMKRELSEYPPIFLRVWRSQVTSQSSGPRSRITSTGKVNLRW